MEPDDGEISKLSKRYTRFAVTSFFLMALLQGLHGFFFTLFFWPALGFSALALYYRIAGKRQEQSFSSPWHQPDAAPAARANKRITLLVIVGAVSLLVIISSLFSSRKSSTSTQQTTQNNESGSEDNEMKPSSYEQALKEYDNKNYKQSISIAKQALLGDTNNNDLMLVLGDDYGGLKQQDSAFYWFNRVYQNGVRSAYLSHWLGFLYDEKGSLSQALEFYKDALKQDSSRTQVYDRLAELEPEKAAWYKKKSSQWAASK